MLRRYCAVLCILFYIFIIPASAEGYYYNRRGESVLVPDAYTAGEILEGEALGIGAFDNIQDLFVSGGTLFVADTGNDRIVIIDENNKVEKIITSLSDGDRIIELSSPEGVYYRNGDLYICNTGGQEVLLADKEGRLLRRYTVPETATLSSGTEFKPSKVAVNAAGSVFVSATGIYQGLIQYNREGGFINFFGAVKVDVTPAVVLANIWKNIFSQTQREGMSRIISNDTCNIFIDNEDFIYTVTASVNTNQVRRLNAAGENILKYPGIDDQSLFTSGYNRNNFGDQEFDYSKGQLIVSQISDVHVDSEGIISVLDKTRGKVLQYSRELDPISIFGRTGETHGCFRKASSLEKRGNDYLVADSEKNTITVMKPTSYIQKIRAALEKYQSGKYIDSADEWEDVLKQNPSFTIAYRSVGRALLQEGAARDALEYLKEGDDRYYYSLAMQEYRRDYIRKNWYWLIPLAAVLLIGMIFAVKRLSRWMKSVKRNPKGERNA